MAKEMQVGKKRYVVAENDDPVRKMALQVIDEHEEIKDNVSGAAIEYVLIYPNISKRTIARIVRTSNELKFFSKFDYLIELSGDIWEQISDEIRKIVIEHEFRHAFKKYNFKTDATTYCLVDHNVKDFTVILEKYGIKWFTELQNKSVDLYCKDAKIKDKDDKETVEEKESKLKYNQDKLKNSIKL